MLFCNRGSTSSDPVSLGGGNNLLIPPPPAITEQLPPRRDSLTPTSYLLLNFFHPFLVNRGMYENDYSPILGPGIPVVTLHCVEQLLVRGISSFHSKARDRVDHAQRMEMVFSTITSTPKAQCAVTTILRRDYESIVN
ncbi:hypothetical protein B9Z19DRAFT_1121338 [Tuber borchii]|uniref:Uncharacterized protein n=1 Tax=Tuber borchii TaxID=42251 RepID=A0A2T7A329_TUBBO|nr:hypothetical protein B9Z19DRAFT_1121338 [Tuber borchii]